MLTWAIGFFIAAVVAALLGFGGIATAFASVAQILFYIFAIIFLAVLVAHFLGSGKPTQPPAR